MIRASFLLTAYALCAVVPVAAIAQAHDAPYEQDFVLTAYYSPLPDQCCYVKGSYEADMVLNGKGTHAADGTPVYEGMLAAPPSYAFGTQIHLPGLGTMTVHDRGGAIQEWDDTHRLDVWAGRGEEGLARALAFGVKRIRGTVYPISSAVVAPQEAFTLEQLPAPAEYLKAYAVEQAGAADTQQIVEQQESMSMEQLPAPAQYLKAYAVAQAGAADTQQIVEQEESMSVQLLQERLAQLGYFQHEITGVYGEVTKQALAMFIQDMKLQESAESLTETTALYLEAALSVSKEVSAIAFVEKESAPADIKKAQRTLRFLGYYRGRTNGHYSLALFSAIAAYQHDHQLVGDITSPGAGRIGPRTKGVLDAQLHRNRVARKAKQLLLQREIRLALQNKGILLGTTMQKGMSGSQVKRLQTLLAARGFFPAEKINGYFGDATKAAVLNFQLARELVASAEEIGAGIVGPVTLRALRSEQVREMYKLVRAQGMQVL